MTAKVLSVYILTLLLFASPLCAEGAPSTSAVQPAAVQTTTAAIAAAQTTESANTPAEWAFVLRAADSTTYLRMDTITRAEEDCGTVLYGEIKKTYTKHGLLQIYYSLKSSHESDEDTLALLKQIDHSITHVSYFTNGTGIFHRLHRVTFYDKSENALETLDFDDIARQTDTDVAWQEVTRPMTEERAIFYRLANG